MTRQEFISRQEALRKSGNKIGIVFLVVFFGFLLGGIPIGDLADHGKTVPGIIFVFGFFGFLIGFLLFLRRFKKRHQKRFNLSCPSCGKPLLGVISQVAIATGNCGYCGARVFDEGHTA